MLCYGKVRRINSSGTMWITNPIQIRSLGTFFYFTLVIPVYTLCTKHWECLLFPWRSFHLVSQWSLIDGINHGFQEVILVPECNLNEHSFCMNTYPVQSYVCLMIYISVFSDVSFQRIHLSGNNSHIKLLHGPHDNIVYATSHIHLFRTNFHSSKTSRMVVWLSYIPLLQTLLVYCVALYWFSSIQVVL